MNSVSGPVRDTSRWKNLFWIVPAAICVVLAPDGGKADFISKIGFISGWLTGVFAVGIAPAVVYCVYCFAQRRRPSIVSVLSIVSSSALLFIFANRLGAGAVETMLNAEATRPPAPQGQRDGSLFPVKPIDSPDWNWIAKSMKGDFWVDFTGMKRDRDEVQILVKQAYREPRPTPQGIASGMVTMMQIDCTQKQFTSRWERTYDVAGTFNGLTLQSGAEKANVPPGSVVESIMQRACKGKSED